MQAKSGQDNALIEQVKSEYGLRVDPFSRAVSVFYSGGQRQHNLETMRHLGIFGDMILLLTGEKGAGKTRLLEEFSSLYEQELRFFPLSAGLKDAQGSLLSRALTLSGVPRAENETPQQLLSKVISHFEQEFRESGRRLVWMIDDADQLSEAELNLLLEQFRRLPPESGVVLLLSGLPALVDRLVLSVQVPDGEWLHQVHLKPFGESEVIEYLQLRLHEAGFQGELVLDAGQLNQLMEMGKGLPGRIHRVFPAIALGVGEITPKAKPVKNNMAQYVLFSVAFLLLLSFLFVSYQHGFFASDDASNNVGEPVQASFEEKTRVLADMRAKAAKEVAARLAERDGLAVDVKANDNNLTVFVGEGAVEEGAGTEGVMHEPDVSADLQKVASGPEGEENQDSDEQIAEKAVDSVVLNNEVESAEIAVSSNAELEVLSEAVPQALQGEAEPLKSKHGAYRTSSWLKAKPADHYTLQMLGSHNQETAIKFIESARQKASLTEADLVFVETRYKSKPWYVVLYGDFADKAAARKASLDAPAVLKKQKPWLRSYQSVAGSLP